MRILAPADALLHVCGHAATSASPRSLVWVPDAWWILQSLPEWEWELVEQEAARRRLALPLAVMLRYLADELNAPVPPTVARRLAAVPTDVLDREAAVHGISAAGKQGVVRLLRAAPDWPTRARVLRWLTLPSPRYLCEVAVVSDERLLARYYMARLWAVGRRVAADRVRQR